MITQDLAAGRAAQVGAPGCLSLGTPAARAITPLPLSHLLTRFYRIDDGSHCRAEFTCLPFTHPPMAHSDLDERSVLTEGLARRVLHWWRGQQFAPCTNTAEADIMDNIHFDGLAKSLSIPSRRGVFAGAATAVIASLFAVVGRGGPDSARAAKKKKKSSRTKSSPGPA